MATPKRPEPGSAGYLWHALMLLLLWNALLTCGSAAGQVGILATGGFFKVHRESISVRWGAFVRGCGVMPISRVSSQWTTTRCWIFNQEGSGLRLSASALTFWIASCLCSSAGMAARSCSTPKPSSWWNSANSGSSRVSARCNKSNFWGNCSKIDVKSGRTATTSPTCLPPAKWLNACERLVISNLQRGQVGGWTPWLALPFLLPLPLPFLGPSAPRALLAMSARISSMHPLTLAGRPSTLIGPSIGTRILTLKSACICFKFAPPLPMTRPR